MKTLTIYFAMVAVAATLAYGSEPYRFNRYGLTAANRAALRQFGIKGEYARFFTEMGYTPETLRQFEAADGTRVAADIANRANRTESTKALLADYIVHATVEKVEPIVIGPFHGVATLKVSQFYRNDYGDTSNVVQVLLFNGPSESNQATTDNVDDLQEGNEVWVFLSAASLYMDMQRNYPRALQQLQSSSTLYYQIQGLLGGVYRPSNGRLATVTGRSVTVEAWESSVTKTVKVLGK